MKEVNSRVGNNGVTKLFSNYSMYPPIVTNSYSLSSFLYFYINANVRLMKVKYKSFIVKEHCPCFLHGFF